MVLTYIIAGLVVVAINQLFVMRDRRRARQRRQPDPDPWYRTAGSYPRVVR